MWHESAFQEDGGWRLWLAQEGKKPKCKRLLQTSGGQLCRTNRGNELAPQQLNFFKQSFVKLQHLPFNWPLVQQERATEQLTFSFNQVMKWSVERQNAGKSKVNTHDAFLWLAEERARPRLWTATDLKCNSSQFKKQKENFLSYRTCYTCDSWSSPQLPEHALLNQNPLSKSSLKANWGIAPRRRTLRQYPLGFFSLLTWTWLCRNEKANWWWFNEICDPN